MLLLALNLVLGFMQNLNNHVYLPQSLYSLFSVNHLCVNALKIDVASAICKKVVDKKRQMRDRVGAIRRADPPELEEAAMELAHKNNNFVHRFLDGFEPLNM